jgi:hypothetical protein
VECERGVSYKTGRLGKRNKRSRVRNKMAGREEVGDRREGQEGETSPE